MLVAGTLHFHVDGACHDVARGERTHRVMLAHELNAREIFEHCRLHRGSPR